MEKEINIFDIIKPIWNARYPILLNLILVIMITYSVFSLASYALDINKSKYWLQDISFNENMRKSNITNFLNDERIKRAYKSINLSYSKNSETSGVTLLKGTSRYDVLKDTVLADSEELLINVIGEKDEDIVGFWNSFLNLETSYYQIVLKDESLTELQAGFIINELINDFNYDYTNSNSLNLSKIGSVTYDNKIDSYVYLNDRLSVAKSILQNNSVAFKNINFDATEVVYRINKLLLQIYNEDPSPLEINLEKLNFQIQKNQELKQKLQALHSRFYNSPEQLNAGENPSQITVDAITQLIDIGKEFSQLDYQENIIKSVYDIDLSIKSIEQNIFDMNSLKKQYLQEKHSELSIEEMIAIASRIIQELNANIEILDSYNSELPLYYIGNTYSKTDSKFDINVNLFVLFSSILYITIYIVNIFYRKSSFNS